MTLLPTSAHQDGHRLAEELAHADPDDQVELLAAVPDERADEAFRSLEAEHQSELLDRLPGDRRRRLLRALRPDERARLLATVDEERTAELLDLLTPDQRAVTEPLVRYPAESVGRIMTPLVLTVGAEDRRVDVLDAVRDRGGDVDTVYTLPVTDGDGRLVGVLDLRAMLTADDDARVADVMGDPEPALDPESDREVAARAVLTTEVLAAPVVDADGRLLGLVTVDDAMEVLELENAEDVLRSSGSEPVRGPYLSSSVIRLARSRATWLTVAAAAAIVTVNVLEVFEAELSEVVTLSVFIPLLLGTGGNAGSQATATVVRALAVGGVRFGDLARVAVRETGVGLLLGGLLGALAVAPVWLLYSGRMATVVALTLVGVCAIAALIGSTLPILADRLGLDPAVVSAPFITSLADASGLLLYFTIAKAVFGI